MAKDTEQIILDTARKHFVQHGFVATRMQDIADEAGINKAMLHYYFRKKEQLYQKIVIQTLDMVAPRLMGAMTKEGEFWDRIENIIDTYINLLLEQPDIPFFIMSELSQNRESLILEVKKRAHYFPAIQGFLMQIQQEMNEGRIKNMPLLQFFLSLMGMMIFPFVVKPMFSTIFSLPEDKFTELMRQRKDFLVDFLKGALRPD